MRVAVLTMILLVGTLAQADDPLADYPLAEYATATVEQVVATAPGGAPQYLSKNQVGPVTPGTRYRITIIAGGKTHDAQYTATGKPDYPATLRPGDKVSYRLSERERIWCDVHAVMRMSRVPVLILRDSTFARWTLSLYNDDIH